MSNDTTHHIDPPQERPANYPGPYLPAGPSAKHIGVSVNTLWRYLRDDPTFPTPFRPTCRKTMFAVPELDAWMETKRAAAPVKD